MFHRTGEFGGKLFFSVQKAICRKKNSFGQNLKISNFPRTKAFGINLKVSISSHLFKNVTPCHDFALNSADSYQFFFPTATKITCNFPFNRPLAAASPSTNRPKSKSRYLAIVSLKHGRLVRIRSQYSLFRRSPTRQNLPPATFDASEHLLYSLPFAPVQNMAVRFAVLINFRKKS